MHPLLHTDKTAACEELAAALEECHARGFMWKAMGNCNHAKRELSKCLRAERMKRQSANRSEAEEKKERIRQKWNDIDANS